MSKYNHIYTVGQRLPIIGTLLLWALFSSSTNTSSKIQQVQTISKNLAPINIDELFFPVVYTGNGMNQMNINLVDLKLSGLMAGDEIGVFDSIYCVGSTVISDLDISQNLVSILASTNDTIESNPNGFVPGHVVKLKLYRQGVIYPLSYMVVNNSKNTFESNGSMFALIDFLNSSSPQFSLSYDNIKVYPVPFEDVLYIEIQANRLIFINCEIFDSNGKLIKTIINNFLTGEKVFIWDGKNDNNQKINSGIYYLRTNNLIKKVVLNN